MRAYTLLELTLVIAILGVIAFSVAPGLATSVRTYNIFTARSAGFGQARAALDKMVMEIQLIPSSSEVNTINATQFDFEYPSGTSISYNLNGTTLRRNSDDLLKNVSALSFTYYNELGAVTATASEVRSVQVQVTVSPPQHSSSYFIRTRAFLRNLGNSFPGALII